MTWGANLRVVIETERLVLGLPGPEAAPLLVKHYVENQDHRGPWDPKRPDGFFTVPFWETALSKARAEYASRVSMKLVLFSGEDVAGTCNFTQVTGKECRLGYGLDQRFEGKGFMTEALVAAIPHAFERFGVERIRASHLPANVRSERLLERLGFKERGPERQLVGRRVIIHRGVELVRPGRGSTGTWEAHGAPANRRVRQKNTRPARPD